MRVNEHERALLTEAAELDGYKSVGKWMRELAKKRAKRLGLEWPADE